MRTSTKIIKGLLVALVALMPSIALADDYPVRATGYWFCYDGTTRKTEPMVGARVELWDSDCLGSDVCDDLMAVGYVSDDGSFDISGTGGDGGSYSWSPPDPYVRVVYTDDQGIQVVDEIGNMRHADTPHHDHDNMTGTIDFGGWAAEGGAGDGQGTQCGTYLAARKAYADYQKIKGEDPPAGHFHVLYWSGVVTGTPWTNRDTVHWPVGYGTHAMTHEFGHSVRHAFDGDDNEFNLDVFRYRYARTHELCDGHNLGDIDSVRRAFAFNEGWAEFWAGDTWGCTAGGADYTIEGDVARRLNQLSYCVSPAMGGTIGKRGMTTVLDVSPGAIHSMEDFEQRMHVVFPDMLCPANGLNRTLAYLTKGMLIPASQEWVDTGLDIMPSSALGISASGLWSNHGAPNVGPAGFVNYKYPGTYLANADLAALIGRVGPSGGFPVGTSFSGATPGSGRLYLGMNDVPGTYGDNQGSVNVSVSYQQPSMTITVPASTEWLDTGLILNQGASITIKASGSWSNIGAPSFGPNGYPGYRLGGQVAPDADFGSLVAKIGSISPRTFGVGANFAGVAPRSGRLYLALNDLPGTYGDNHGQVYVTITYPEQRTVPPVTAAMVAQHVVAVTSAASRIEADLADARADAAAHVACDAYDGCASAFAAQIRPPLLAGTLALVKLEQGRLATSATDAGAAYIEAQHANGTLDRYLGKLKKKYAKKAASIQRSAMKKAISAGARLAMSSQGVGSAAPALLDELRGKLAAFQQLVKEKRDLPIQFQAIDGAVEDTVIAPATATDIAQPRRLTVELNTGSCWSWTNSGTVSSLPTGMNCTTSGDAVRCSAEFPSGTSVTLSTTSSSPSSSFSGFSGACTGSTCTVRMDTDKVVSGNFCYVVI